ncbi:MAG TPA: hypothetical protein VKK61_03725 [Tepidisphaeraceae bacterium]|nr:hypothetical protein [Tepidisphaeraceae bacterium]
MDPTLEQPQSTNHIWDTLHLPQHWPVQADLLQWCQTMGPGEATILVMGGIVYLLYGYYIFRGLVLLNAGFFGAYVGSRIGEKAGSMFAGALMGGFIAGALAWPFMKYSVALMGGIFGALLGASAWRAIGLQPEMCWAGALMGLIAFGLLSFILFRVSVMMFTSLQGSVMLIFGILGLIYKYKDAAPKVTENMTIKPFLLPLAIFVPAILGLVYQHHQFGEADKK